MEIARYVVFFVFVGLVLWGLTAALLWLEALSPSVLLSGLLYAVAVAGVVSVLAIPVRILMGRK